MLEGTAPSYTRGLIEASLDPLVALSPDGKIADANQALELATGVARTRLLGTDFAAYFVEHGKARQSFEEALAKGSTRDVPLAIRHTAGQVTEVLCNASVHRDAQGRVLGVFVAARDITGRRAAEALLRKLEVRFSKVFELSPLPMTIVRRSDRRYVDVNASYLRCLGYERGEVVGHGVDELGIWAHPEVREATLATLAEKGAIPQFEAAFRTKSGEEREILAGAEVIELDGDSCILGVFHDITDLKRAERALRLSEARYRRIVETTQEGIWMLDRENRTTFVNERMARMLGYSSEEMVGEPLFQYLEPEVQELSASELAKQGGSVGVQMELPCRRKDGTALVALIVTNPILDDRGRFVGTLAMLTDVTQQRATARLRDEILDVISHEFRTPVTIIQGYAQLLTSGAWTPDEKSWQEARRRIEGATQHLGFLLTSITEIAVIRSGGATARLEEVPTADLVADALKVLEWRGRSASQTVAVDIRKGAETVMADRRKLTLALGEVLDNARKFSPPPSEFAIEAVIARGAFHLEIRDRGYGFPADIMARPFVPFSQGNLSSAREAGGAGLGLALVNGLVQVQGGRVEIEAREGGGSTVRFVLPLPPHARSEPPGASAS